MDPLIIGAGIAAIGSIIGNLIQGHSSKKNTQAQIEYDQSALNQQNAFNVEMWNKTNEYNSPVNERARLEEAGINPLNVSGNLGPASALQSAGALGYQQPIAINPFEGAFDSVLTAAQVENVQADTAKKTQESLTEVQRREQMKSEIDKNKQLVSNYVKEGNLTDEQLRGARIANKYLALQEEANLHYKESQTAINESQRNRIDKLIDKELQIADLNILEFDKKFDIMIAQAQKERALAGIASKDLKYYVINKLSEDGWNLGDCLMLLNEYGDEAGEALDNAKKLLNSKGAVISSPTTSLSGHHYRSRQ